MELVYIILPLALLLAGFALLAFIWAARSGQFDDLETPSRRVLFDEVPVHDDELVHDDESSTEEESRES